MKSFKNFLNEAANAIIKLGDSGWATRLKGKGGYTDSSGEWYFKKTRELFKKSKYNGDLKKSDLNKYNGKINGEYKKITNPIKSKEPKV